jgi:hypothetical protein
MTEYASNLIDISAQLRGETDKAVRIFDGATTVWLPKSQVEVEHAGDGRVTVTMPEWLAKDKGLI